MAIHTPIIAISGIIIVDKPTGWTSHDVVAKLRGALKVKRVGHGGTLDPMATGLLPVFIGRATRAVEFFENSEKEYIAGLRLGMVTDTQDITGNVLDLCESPAISTEDLLAVLPRFLGAQKQIPPMYSAIKQGGKKLYELARQGIEVPRPPRDIHISAIELLDRQDGDFLLRIACSKGTYIRTLCHDIGQALGRGAVMSSLRRTRAGGFSINMAHRFDEILEMIKDGCIESVLKPVDSMFSEYPSVTLSEAETRKCKNGALLNIAALTDGIFRFYSPDGEFVMIGKAESGVVTTIKSFFSV